MALTPYMSLLLPTVSSTVGPTYATEMNAAISNGGGDIDSHDHSSGKGKLVGVSGLNINANLPLSGNSITGLASMVLIPQSVPATLNTLSLDANGNLYVNDNGGNSIQMTSAGLPLGGSATNGIAGAGYGTGGVTISWNAGSKAYAFMQSATKFALLSTGEISLFDATNASVTKSVNLLCPPALAASYNLTFPLALPAAGNQGLITVTSAGQLAFGSTLVSPGAPGKAFVVVDSSGVPSVLPASYPSAQAMVTIDNSGNISNIQPDNTSLIITGTTTLGVKAQGITKPLLVASNTVVATTAATTTSGSSSLIDISNATLSITTSNSATARPVLITLQPDGTGTAAYIGNAGNFASSFALVRVLSGTPTQIAIWILNAGAAFQLSPSSISFIDVNAAANTSYTYKLQYKTTAGGTAQIQSCKLVAQEQ